MNTRVLPILVLSMLSSTSYASISGDWEVNGHHYLSTDTLSTWSEASELANSLGGYLVSITSEEEQAFLISTFLSIPEDASSGYWIGFTDKDEEGSFVWTSGEETSYTNWGASEPNDYQSGVSTGIGEDYAVFNWQYSNGFDQLGFWNDVPNSGCTPSCTDSQLYKAIIEFVPTPVPVPGAVWLFSTSIFGLIAASRRKN